MRHMKTLFTCLLLTGLTACTTIVQSPAPHVMTHEYTWKSVRMSDGSMRTVRMLPDTANPAYWADPVGPKPCANPPPGVISCVEWPLRSPNDPPAVLWRDPPKK